MLDIQVTQFRSSYLSLEGVGVAKILGATKTDVVHVS